MKIRHETPADIVAIENVTLSAFRGKSYSDETEHLIVNLLRDARALYLSLVAEDDGQLIGHIAFSGVSIVGDVSGWYALGPISVLPAFQRRGIGSQLISQGLSDLRGRGAQGCVLEGSPQYYGRFGFRAYPGLVYTGAPSPEYFMALPFCNNVPKGRVEFHPAFYVKAG